MIKKKISLLVTGALVAGLVACNNNEAMDRNDENDQIDVAENVNYNGRDNVPFVRDVNDENEFRGMWDRDNRNQEINRNNEQNGLEISSTKTDIDSNKYPHTKAITVQDAKFKFVQADNQEEAQRQAEKYIQQFRQQAEQRARQFAQQGQLQRPQQQNQAQVPQQQPEQREQQQAPAQQQQPEQREQQQAPAQQQQPEQREQQQAPAPQQQPEQREQQQANQAQKPEAQKPAQGISQAAQQVIELTNAERQKNGLPPLKGDTQLSGVAQKKSEDMRQNNYFSHTSPTYGSPFDMMRDFGVTYRTAGENIAQGQQTPQQVVQAWMNSEGHRKNILSRDFTHIGVGYDANGHHWTQMFIGK